MVAWLIVFGVGLLAGGQVTERLTGGSGAASTHESIAASQMLGKHDTTGPRISAVVDGVAVDDPRLRSALGVARGDLSGIDGVAKVTDPLQAGPTVPAALAPLVATDRHAVLVTVTLKKDLPASVQTQADSAVEARLRAVAGDLPGSRVLVGGDSLTRAEAKRQTNDDTRLGEAIALPVTLVVMVLLFGGFVVAGVPFLAALASIGGGLLALLGFSYLIDLNPSVLSVTTVLGLGLAIDYSLLLVSRFREERAAGGTDVESAVSRTVATAGRTVMFSALTVATALSGLFVFPSPIFRAIGAAGVGVVLVAMAAAVTLTPALLAAFARWIRIKPGHIANDGFFAWLARGTRRFAVPVTLAVAALLLAAGLPFLRANFINSTSNLLPADFETRRFAELVTARFPGRDTDPVQVVAETDKATLQRWADTLRGTADVAPNGVGVAETRGDLSVVTVTPVKSDRSEAAKRLVERLRAQRPAGFRTWIGGQPAGVVDFTGEVATYAPWAALLVGLATFVLLFLMTGSVLVPLKALVMNTLSLGASFGALVLIFQDGHGASLLGFTAAGGLETFIPVIVFAFAFGLSMDYEVFLLSRVKELYDAGLSNDEAVERGLQRSGRIITSAAALMVIVFLGFAAGKMLSIKEMGLAMAIAVVVDATLVRCLLVPATMTLLGRLNWWAPGPLRRLHARIGLREAPPATVPTPDPGSGAPAPVGADR